MTVEPCLPLLSILTKDLSALKRAIRKIETSWTDFRLITPRYLFNESNYYADEMGSPIFRWWGYRDILANPAKLVDWKGTCELIEDALRDDDGNRTVNLDPGYLNYGIVVLGSHKHHHQKIYLGDDVYADPVLEYVDGSYQSFHWSFPDFRDDRYYSLLDDLRDRYSNLRK